MKFGPLVSAEYVHSAHGQICLLDAQPGAEAFEAQHLKGAQHSDLNTKLSTASDPGFDPAKGGRHPLPHPARWAEQLGQWGIGPETFVVAYDGASGANAASRLWWMLRAMGHSKVAVLDGGLVAAKKAGLCFEKGKASSVNARAPYSSSSATFAWKKPTVAIEIVAQRLEEPAWKVLDVRSHERWMGETEPLDPVAGRLPGSVNLPFSENLDSDGLFQSPETLRKMYSELLSGISPDHLIVHCGSGVTACHTLLALDLAGFPGASLYVGSYSEWSLSGRRIARG